MTFKERITYYLLWAFAAFSIGTGLIMRFAPPVEAIYPPPTIYDKLYFFGEQLCEVTLLFSLFMLSSNFRIRLLSKCLLILSAGEMFDECIGNNFNITINDYVFVIAALFYIYKYSRNERNKARNI